MSLWLQGARGFGCLCVGTLFATWLCLRVDLGLDNYMRYGRVKTGCGAAFGVYTHIHVIFKGLSYILQS